MSATKDIWTVGRRKTSVARVRLTSGTGKMVINNREAENYFSVPRMLKHAQEPIATAGVEGKFDLKIRVHGGGVGGQAGAVRLAIARALDKENENTRPGLKKFGMFTRDPRMVERKKPGLRKARRGTQFSKR